MARTKRLVDRPDANTRPAVRRRTSDDQTPGPVNADLNEPPPFSGEAPVISHTPDTGSSQRESPRAVSSSRVSDPSPILFDDPAFQNDEEMKRLAEEYHEKVSAIKKRKEEEEMRRKEEQEIKRKEEEERVRLEEEKRRLEAEKQKKEEEERLREEERLQREEIERQAKEDEERKKAEEARVKEEEQKRAEDERLASEAAEKQRISEEKTKAEQIPAKETPPEKTTDRVEVVQTSAHSEETPTKPIQANRRVLTRSGATKPASSSKPKRAASTKGKGKKPVFYSSSLDTNTGSEQPPSESPYQSTLGTAHAPSGIAQQFTSDAAKAHYKSICGRKLNLERGFDPDFIEENPFIKNRIMAQDWANITTANRRANASLVREFYAEASQAKETFVKVRGKVVDYSPSNINRVLGRRAPEPCRCAQFLAKMTEADEELVLKEIAEDGRKWNFDGQRKCLHAGSLTTEAAVWFQFLRASVAPTSHDTTLSMHKCAMLYCVLTERKINLGIIMSGAIHQARTRTKVILPLPCLITQILTDAGVPTAAKDQFLVSTKNIGVQTIKKMGRELGSQSDEQMQPNVQIAEEHVVGTKLPTVTKKGSPLRPQAKGKASTSAPSPLTSIFQAISSLSYKVDRLTATQRIINRALESVWAYNRDRDEVIKNRYMKKDPLFAAQLPEFPEGICPNMDGADDVEEDFEEDSEEDSGDSTPTDTPSH